MAKSKSSIRKEEPESMLDQKTYEDFNKEKPDLTDPNQTDNAINKSGAKIAGKSTSQGAKQMTAKMYVCSKHPNVITTKPGKCPTCGKVLQEKK
jgi:rubrerythrin